MTYIATNTRISAATNPRHAVVKTRHRSRTGRPAASADDGDQDADTAPEPLPVEPTTPSTGALPSVHGDDVARQVQHRQPKQARIYQHQHVEDSAGSAVAVREGVDGLELVVCSRHPHERVTAVVGVDESLPRGELLHEDIASFRRAVGHFYVGHRGWWHSHCPAGKGFSVFHAQYLSVSPPGALVSGEELDHGWWLVLTREARG